MPALALLTRAAAAACLLAALAVCLPSGPAAAQRFGHISEVMTVRVLPGWREADGRHIAGLAVRLKPGWRTYWRSAGSLGISPSFDWRGSRNLRAVAPVWPTPEVFHEAAGQSVGYDRDFVLPLVVAARDAAAPVRLAGRMSVGVCADICVPAELDLDATLPATGAPDAAIRAALADRPRRVQGTARCQLAPGPDGMHLVGELALADLGGREAVVFELPGTDLWIADARVERRGATLLARSKIHAKRGAPLAFDRSRLRITAFGRSGAVEMVGCRG